MRYRRASGLALRVFVPALGLIIFLALAILYQTHSAIVFTLLRLWGIHPPVTYPFLDLQNLFAATGCWDKNLNVYVFNPCDPLGRVFNYSPLLLRLPVLPPHGWAVAGILIDVLFLSSLAALPPPQNRRDLLILLLATLSPPIAFALQRANLDVVVFIVLLAAARMWVGCLSQRICSYVIVFVTGLLKFYPLILVAMSVRERPRVFVVISATCGAILVGLAWSFYSELAQVMANIPSGAYFMSDMLGAVNLPGGVLFIFHGTHDRWLTTFCWIALFAFFLTFCLKTLRWSALHDEFKRMDALPRALLIFGATIISGCFFCGQSVGYREIFLLFLLPSLFAVRQKAADHDVRRFATQSVFVLLFLLWQGVLTWGSAFLLALKRSFGSELGNALWLGIWAGRELAWWLVVATLVALLIWFAMEGETVNWIKERSALRTMGQQK